MEHEAGDDYIRRISSFIRANERALAETGVTRRRRGPPVPKPAPGASSLNPISWFGLGAAEGSASPPPKPVNLSIDTHHLFYVLMRLEDIGLEVGTLDVKVDNPSKPMNYINIFRDSDKSDTLSLASFRSSLSAVSGLSLGRGWWGRPEPRAIDAELKYLFSSFTMLPALILTAPGSKMVAELANEPPNENCLPLDLFRNLQTFECADIDPRTVLGWDKLSVSLRSLTIKRSGLEDVSDVFIGAVLDDLGRREGTTSRSRRRYVSQRHAAQASFYSTRLPDTVPEANEESAPPTPLPGTQPALPTLPSHKWETLRHLSLSDNALTFLPTDPLAYLTSLTHLDLSSNLLVSVPPGLSALYNLASLNLADNMIDSVLGIYTHLGQILSLNLARNRLESICGLERLLALERVDLRHNLIDESAEIGRLALLPNIAAVWVGGNPFVDIEEAYRITCFDYFVKEGKTVMLDGAAPGYYEKKGLSVLPPEQMSSSRVGTTTAHSPPVVAVGGATRRSPTQDLDAVPSPEGSLPGSRTDSPQLAPVGVGKERRKKNKRIVDLSGDGGEASDASSHFKHAHAHARRPVHPPMETAVAPTGTRPVPHRSRHSRHQSEYSPAPAPPSPPSAVVPSDPVRSATLSKSAARRLRVSASVFEPPTTGRGGRDVAADADAYRRRVEALRSDMGDGWLKVFNQGQMGSPPGVASG